MRRKPRKQDFGKTPNDFVLAQKVETPEEDFKRMSENLWTNFGDMIDSQETFEIAYKDYFQTDFVPKLKDKEIRSTVWDNILRKHRSSIIKEDREPLRSKAKAMTVKQEKGKEPIQPKVVTQREFLRLALSGSDMNLYMAQKKFEFLGKQQAYTAKRARTVFARVINTKAGIRFIDSKGRYVSVQKPMTGSR